MSAGNLYRYFASKEAIVTGLAERDREMLTLDFGVMAGASDFFACFEAIGRKHLVEEPREKAVLAVEIWSESCRNPHISALCDSMDCEVRQGMVAMLGHAKAAGAISPETDVEVAVQVSSPWPTDCSSAARWKADFDGEYEIAVFMQFFRMLLTGGFKAPPRPLSTSVVSSPAGPVSAHVPDFKP